MIDVSQAEKQLEQIRDYILSRYNPEHCAYTEENSSGNETDVFSDGYDCGVSETLYKIGKMIGMDLPEPLEPEW